MVACGFNTLIPAFVFKLQLLASYPIGALDTGYSLSDGIANGTFTSLPEYGLPVEAHVIHFNDFVSVGENDYQVNAQGLLQTAEGEYIAVQAEGPFVKTDKVDALLKGQKDAVAMEWGESYAVTYWTFQTSDTKYRDLQDSRFVGNMRLSPNNDDGPELLNIEYHISKLESGACLI